MRKIITATFKGEDGSLGYQTGKFYALIVEYQVPTLRRLLKRWPADWKVIIVDPTFCPYTSWYAFIKNWQIHDVMGRE